MAFECKRCGYECSRQQHLLNHLQKKTPCRVTVEDITRERLVEEIQDAQALTKQARDYVKCDWCECDVTKKNLARHKKTCSSQPKDDIEDLRSKYEALKERLEEFMRTPSTGTVTNVVINNNTVDNSTNVMNVVNIHSFGNEKVEHIQGDYVKHCILNNLRGMKSLIEKIHFSDEAPENKNIRMKSIKNKLVEVKGEDKWIVKDANEAMETMINKGCRLANEYYFDETNGLMERDLNDLDMKIQKFLTDIMQRDSALYFALRKRILALIIENTDAYD